MTSTKLKLIAIVSMLVDHTAIILASHSILNLSDPTYLIMRGIGRLAFPIFAFLIAEGYKYTRNKNKYLYRLLVFALLSEIPFDLALHGRLLDYNSQNVFFTLALGLVVIYIFDQFVFRKLQQRESDITNTIELIIGLLSIFLILLLANFMRTDYFSIGVLMIFTFYIFRDNLVAKTIMFLFINLLLSGFEITDIQIIGSLSILPILLYNHKKGRNLKYIFYAFYPVHLLMLYGIGFLL